MSNPSDGAVWNLAYEAVTGAELMLDVQTRLVALFPGQDQDGTLAHALAVVEAEVANMREQLAEAARRVQIALSSPLLTCADHRPETCLTLGVAPACAPCNLRRDLGAVA